jgi:phytoene dehydrogenase-like protein
VDTNHFDVVVCGSELAGAIAGALLGRRGLRVLLCGLERAPATFSVGRYVLSREPGLLPPPDREPVARVLRELNYVQIVRRRAPALYPALQIVLPRHRLDLGPEEVTARELEREFPGEAATAAAVLARMEDASARLDPVLASDLTLPADGFWERREVARFEAQLPPAAEDLLAPLPGDHPMRASLAALGALASSCGPLDAGGVTRARAWDVARRGVFRLDGGGAALRAMFLDKIAASSGEVRERLAATELVWKRGRVAGVRVQRDETVGLEHLVWAGSAASLVAVSGEHASRRLREIAGAVRPACHRYTLCLLVRPEALPPGMGARVIVVRDPELPLLEDNALAVHVGAPEPRHGAIPIWVECLVTAAAAASGGGYLSIVRAKVREQLGRLMPFFERHLLVLASPHDGLPPELPGLPADAPAPGPVPATPMSPALTSDLPRGLGVAAAPHATGVKNLYLTSAENLPGLGREGDFVSAWGVARLIAGPQPRRDAGRRGDVIIEDV